MQEKRQEAIVGRPANVRNRSETLNIQPGMDPTNIITLPGYATMIAFYDQTGAVWPVKNATTGNPKAFVIIEPQDKENPTNIITTSCVKESGHSNLTVELQDLDIPIMFPIKIAASRKKTPPTIDGILTIRINGFGPRANPPVVEPRPTDPVKVDEIDNFTSPAPVEGLTVSRVKYRYSPDKIQNWAGNGDMEESFPDIKKKLAEGQSETATLVLMDDGWKHGHTKRRGIFSASRGPE